jgi:multidrug efflux pump subunit AcrB
MTEKIMSLGANTPIEVQVAGKDLDQIKMYGYKVLAKLKQIPYLRDVQINQPLDYPVIAITLDRLKVAQLGLNVSDIARSVTASTSSSRFTLKNLWLDEKNAYTYQVQAQVPEYVMNNLDELKEIPLVKGKSSPTLADVATFKQTTVPAEYDRTGPRRFITISANIYKKDLGTATTDVQKAVKSIGDPPKGLIAEVGGMSGLLTETLSSLQNGLGFAVLVIFLLLAANYQSFKVSLTVLVTIPAVILGSITALLITGSTLNLQSYMGMIMSTGVSVANAILIVTNAENLRLEYKDSTKAAVTSASIRLRPILMTSLAMIAGMIPMASGLGEAGEQSAPLGRAVIGGLFASTFAALFILPMVFAWVQEKTTYDSPALMPEESTETTNLNTQQHEI